MRTVELDRRAEALIALERVVDRCVPALMIFRCCNCSHTYRGSTLTPHICPSCGSDEIQSEAA